MVTSFIQVKWKTTQKKNNNKNKTNKQTKNKAKRQKKPILCNISIPFNLCPYSYCFILGAIVNIYL